MYESSRNAPRPMFPPTCRRHSATLWCGRLRPRHAPRHADVLREIVEARDGRLELQVDGAGRAMALLADDHLGLAVRGFHLGLPLDVLVGAGPRLLVAEIVSLSVDEQD